jgi:hypothetical protein
MEGAANFTAADIAVVFGQTIRVSAENSLLSCSSHIAGHIVGS